MELNIVFFRLISKFLDYKLKLFIKLKIFFKYINFCIFSDSIT